MASKESYLAAGIAAGLADEMIRPYFRCFFISCFRIKSSRCAGTTSPLGHP